MYIGEPIRQISKKIFYFHYAKMEILKDTTFIISFFMFTLTALTLFLMNDKRYFISLGLTNRLKI